MDKTALGDRMKAYEPRDRFLPMIPIIARIDGKNFSRFTRGLDRPYDARFNELMISTACYLVGETHARIGYTQSDEITLVFKADSYDSDVFMAGRVQKMVSILAGMATARFNYALATMIPEKEGSMPTFDARVYQVPTETEAANAVLWREQDATKNAVSMAAHYYFGHSATMGLSGPMKQEKMWQEKCVNFNDYPAFFKRGTFVRRERVEKELTPTELARIPWDKRPTGPVIRSEIRQLNMPRFTTVTNREDVIFRGAEPLVEQRL